MNKALFCLVLMLLVCSSAFALTVLDLKPDDRIGGMRILTPYPFYKEEASFILLEQPFLSYKDVDANFFIYNSSSVNTPKGYDIVVIFEDWKGEASAKNRFEKDFKFEAGFQKCGFIFSKKVKKCEGLRYPQLVYVLHYQNFVIRVQPHPDYSFTIKEMFYLSFDMQKLIENIMLKISKFESLVEKEQDIIKTETPFTEPIPPAEEKPVPEEPKQGFFSRNKYYIILFISLFLIIFWSYNTKDLLRGMFLIILGLIILNRYTIFTKNETISLALLWTVTYFLVKWFYIKNIKRKKKR